MPAVTKEIKEEIQSLKRDVAYLKNNMVDKDSIMTEEDYEALLQYRQQKTKGKLTSHKDLKKELGL